MGYPLRILKRLMTHAEFMGWCRYYRHQPFDDERCFDRPAAQITSMVANRHRSKDEPTYQIDDFLHYRQKPDEEVDVDALIISKL